MNAYRVSIDLALAPILTSDHWFPGRIGPKMISAMPEDYSLSEEQKQHFLEHGFIKLENCFSLEDERCKKLMDRVWERLDMDPNDKETWNPWRGT